MAYSPPIFHKKYQTQPIHDRVIFIMTDPQQKGERTMSRKPGNQQSDGSFLSEESISEVCEIIGGESSSNQVLLMKGIPGQIYQISGKIICSDKSFNSGSAQYLLDSLTKGMRKIEQRELGYYIVQKRAPFCGKILVLNTQVYSQKFYISWEYLLLINLDHYEYNLVCHPELKHLKLIEPQNADIPLQMFLQSRVDRPIIEKNLGEDEEIYVSNGQVIGVSQTVSAKKDRKTNMLVFRGPGYVFIEPASKFRVHPKIWSFVLANLAMVSLILILAAMDYFMA